MGARRAALCVGVVLACRSAPATVSPEPTAQDHAAAPIDDIPAPAHDASITPEPDDRAVDPIEPAGPTESIAPPAAEAAPAPGPSDDEIRANLVEASIAEYEGNCPCPYHTMSNGRRCGARSAYSRGGGDAPLCYAHDVTSDMIQQQRATSQ